MKDVAYYCQIATSENFEHPEREYAREIFAVVNGDGFIYEGQAFNTEAFAKLNSLLMEAEANGEMLQSTYSGNTLDETPALIMVRV